MGRMKEYQMKQEEKDWVAEEQQKWLNDIWRWKGVVYGDLIDEEMLADPKFIRLIITTIDGENHSIKKEEIQEINGLNIKYKTYTDYQAILGADYVSNVINVHIIPLDKISSVIYHISE